MGSSSDQETPVGTGHLLQTWWEVEQQCGRNDENICRKSTPYVQVLESIMPKCFWKLRRRKNIYSLLFESRASRIHVGKIITANQFSIYGAVAKWYNKSLLETVESLNQDPNNNVPPELVSHFTEHGTPDVRTLRIQAERYKNSRGTEYA